MEDTLHTNGVAAAHIPVLLKETIEGLELREDMVVVDATLGGGGHARAILEELGARGTLVALDADIHAVEAASWLKEGSEAQVHLVNKNFRHIASVLAQLEIPAADAICADLGWRSDQFLDEKEVGMQKGFSFQVEEPLYMTYGDPKEYAFTARDIINEWKEEDIANVLKGYGEERFARKIAHAIVRVREKTPIETTTALADLVKASVPSPYRFGRIHPATKTFQALRIAVNDELDTLNTFIEAGVACLRSEGKIAIISFHSLEDRIVKHTFRRLAHDAVGTVLTKKAITPPPEEIAHNPRSRSAKLRIFQKQ